MAHSQECISEPGSLELYPESELFNQHSTHIEAEQFLYHSELNTFQLYDIFGQVAPIVCAADKVSDFVDAVFGCDRTVECTPVQGNELWKPKAESNIGAVILVSDSLQNVPVSVTDSSGKEVTTQIRQVCCPNGGREHRFFNKTGESLKEFAPIFIRFSEKRCIRIDDPSIRND